MSLVRSAARLIALALISTLFLAMSLPVAAQEPETGSDASARAQELVDTYAPILVLREQRHPCDREGEPYIAAPVEIVLGAPDILLRQDVPGQPVIMNGPTATDLAGLDSSYYLDMPGDPLEPGCVYEEKSRERMEGLEPTALAHIAKEEGRSGLVIQYWLFYYFNDFNNTHEGDWEMVQVVFDVDTVEEALRTEPVAVGYAQHGGGEKASWDDPKLERDGTHPIVYASRGSHASHYDQAVHLGWSENGTGFGCDITLGPSVSVPLKARLVADSSSDPVWAEEWLDFEGRWGQRLFWEFNGPRDPSVHYKWHNPISWQENLRDASLAVPLSGALGPTPTDVFCRVTSTSAVFFRFGSEHPWLAGIIVVTALGVVATVFGMSRRQIVASFRLYIRHFPAFLPAAGAVVAVGLVTGLVRHAGTAIARTGLFSDVPALWSTLGFALGITQQLSGLLFVAPAAIYATAAARAGRTPSPEAVLQKERQELRAIARAAVGPLVILGILQFLPLGYLLAVVLGVRWLFVPQATLLDNATPARARALSASVVRGIAPRTVALIVTLVALVLALGPVVGLFLLIYAGKSVTIINLVSSVVYALVYPLLYVATTLVYLDRRESLGKAAPEPEPPAGAATA